MDVAFEYKPLPVHNEFHTSTARIRIMFGAFGSGKSYAVLAEAVAWCLEQPGIVGVIARKTVPMLRDAEEPIVLGLIPYALLARCDIKKSGGHIERIIFPNGSHLLFRSMDDPTKWRSLNLGFICFDEMNEIDEDGFNEVYSRVRQSDLTAEAAASGYTHKIGRRGVWGATNPQGHDWIWARFHPDSPTHDKKSACYVSTTLDNPFLPPEFVESMLDMPTQYIARYVLCQFDDFAGRIYDTWTESTHMIPTPSFIPGNDEIFWMGMDPGSRAPTAGLWVWQNRVDNQLVAVAEYEEHSLSADDHVKAWKAIEARGQMRVRWRVADPNSVTQRDRGTQIPLDKQYSKLGFNFQLGASSDKVRIPQLGLLIARRQFVCTPATRRTFDAIKNYQWVDLSPTQSAKGEDAPEKVLKKDTHLVECAQYVAGRRLIAPKPNPYTGLTDDQAFQKEILTQVQKQVRARMGGRKASRHDLGGVNV